MGEPPVLFTADGCGQLLAERLRQLVRGWPGPTLAEGGAMSRGSVARVWLAVQCLPHACYKWEEVSRTKLRHMLTIARDQLQYSAVRSLAPNGGSYHGDVHILDPTSSNPNLAHRVALFLTGPRAVHGAHCCRRKDAGRV